MLPPPCDEIEPLGGTDYEPAAAWREGSGDAHVISAWLAVGQMADGVVAARFVAVSSVCNVLHLKCVLWYHSRCLMSATRI